MEQAFDRESRRLQELVEKVVDEAGATLVQVVNRNGRTLASAGAGSDGATEFLTGLVTGVGAAGVVHETDEKWEVWPEDDGEHIELWHVAGRVCVLTAYEGRERRTRMHAWTQTLSEEISTLFEEVFAREEVMGDVDIVPPVRRLH